MAELLVLFILLSNRVVKDNPGEYYAYKSTSSLYYLLESMRKTRKRKVAQLNQPNGKRLSGPFSLFYKFQ
jgi:hypothetical protein